MENSEDFRCLYCANFIYDRYKCTNNHILCGNCFMKIKCCPLCRDVKLIDANNQIVENIARKKCKNESKGCKLNIYHFDDEHEINCIHNPFHCKFCNTDIEILVSKNAEDSEKSENLENKTDEIVKHFENNCVNAFKIYRFDRSHKPESETEARKYSLSNLPTVPSLVVLDKQYLVMFIPKKSKNKIEFIIFSVVEKYKLSNYMIEFSLNGNILFENYISYKKMIEKPININLFRKNSTIDHIGFIICNKFIINRKTDVYEKDGVTYITSHTVEGEPGSAGNWTKEEYDKMSNEVDNLFSNWFNKT